MSDPAPVLHMLYDKAGSGKSTLGRQLAQAPLTILISPRASGSSACSLTTPMTSGIRIAPSSWPRRKCPIPAECIFCTPVRIAR